jgi:hypothetical protein
MTTTIHQNTHFRNVGMLELVNEPLQNAGQVASMRTSYYPDAFNVRRLSRAAPSQMTANRSIQD